MINNMSPALADLISRTLGGLGVTAAVLIIPYLFEFPFHAITPKRSEPLTISFNVLQEKTGAQGSENLNTKIAGDLGSDVSIEPFDSFEPVSKDALLPKIDTDPLPLPEKTAINTATADPIDPKSITSPKIPLTTPAPSLVKENPGAFLPDTPQKDINEEPKSILSEEAAPVPKNRDDIVSRSSDPIGEQPPSLTAEEPIFNETSPLTEHSAPQDEKKNKEQEFLNAKNRLLDLIRNHNSYPRQARQRGLEGSVLLSFTIKEGQISSYRIVKSSGVRILDAAAGKAAKDLIGLTIGTLSFEIEVPIVYVLVDNKP